jgi:hypothetical protein
MDGNHLLKKYTQKNTSIQDSMGNEENGCPVPAPTKP